MKQNYCIIMFLLLLSVNNILAEETYPANWSSSASFVIGTTRDWVFIPDSVSVLNFPLLVRLDSASFQFSQAKPGGEDIRFYNAGGKLLTHEIDYWDPITGKAAIWVKVDTITGNSIQSIKMYWGMSDLSRVDNSASVFDTLNGFSGVWHLGENSGTVISDATVNGYHGKKKALMEPVPVDGMIGLGQYFDGKDDHIDLGDPAGRNYLNSVTSATLSAWVKIADIATNNQGVLQLSIWNDGEINAASRACLEISSVENRFKVYARAPDEVPAQTAISPKFLDIGAWYHLTGVINYATNSIQLYINGELDTSLATAFQASAIDSANTRSGAIGSGDNTTYDYYNGIIDEVRVSKVARSPWWIKLSYENQNSTSTLVSLPVVNGCTKHFATSDTTVTINEGEIARITGIAKCAFLANWSKTDGQKYVLVPTTGTDLIVSNSRVKHDTTYRYRFNALYESLGGSDTLWKSIDVNVNIKEAIPEPQFVLSVDSIWDGSVPLVIKPQITNLNAVKSSKDSVISYVWSTSGVEVSTEEKGDSLVITNAYEDGDLNVKLCLDNGLAECRLVRISVKRVLSANTVKPLIKKLNFYVKGQLIKIPLESGDIKKIEITDIYGRSLRTLTVFSEIAWDGKNQYNRDTAPGLYIVNFYGEKHAYTCKVVIPR